MNVEMVITEVNPEPKLYKIHKSFMGDFYFCFPETEIEMLELLICYGGNIINSDMTIFFRDNIHELPSGLIVNGYLDISRTLVGKLPDDIIIKGNLYIDHLYKFERPKGLVGRFVTIPVNSF